MNPLYLSMALYLFSHTRFYYRFHLLDIRSARSRNRAYLLLGKIPRVLDTGREMGKMPSLPGGGSSGYSVTYLDVHDRKLIARFYFEAKFARIDIQRCRCK